MTEPAASQHTRWNIDGKTVVITGATSGIGRAGAIDLARQGAQVTVIGRNPTKLVELRGEIAADTGEEIDYYVADLSDLDQIDTVAGEILAEVDRIDVLINNAGVAATSARVLPSGFDEMMAANYLGPFMLTHLLMGRVLASAPARIIFTGSEAHRLTSSFDVEDLEDLGEYRGPTAQLAYGRTKLLDILAVDELARRLDDHPVEVVSFCPGLVGTGLMREIPGGDRATGLLNRTPIMRTPEQGARMMVHLAATPEITGGDGGFHTSTPGAKLLRRRPIRRNRDLVRRIYERTCELVGVEPL